MTNRFTDTQTYHYDKTGNITNDKTETGDTRNFTFNGDNKQVEIRDPNIAVTTANPDANIIGKYFYDGEGKRVKKVTVDTVTVFVYSAGKLAEEYSTEAPPPAPTINYVHTDTLQSVRAVSDKLGNIISRRDFMPYGEELTAIDDPSGTAPGRTTAQKYTTTGKDSVRQRFTGYEKDQESGLDFAEARYYNNRHGRFTAVDPLLASGKSANPQTFNRYVYTMNRPLMLTDKSGMQAGSSLGFWTFRDALSTDGQTQSRQFVYFHNTAEQETSQAIWGGNSFQNWNGGQFYIYGGNSAIHLPENGNGQLFSTRAISSEDLNNLTSTQESGQSFSGDQTQALERTYANYLNYTNHDIQVAKVVASMGGPALGGAVENGLAAGADRLLSRINFSTAASEPGVIGNSRSGTVILNQTPIGEDNARHLTVRSVGGPTTELVNLNGTARVQQTSGRISIFTNRVTVPNIEGAINYQNNLLNTNRGLSGRYNIVTNSCVTHACGVLRAGGLSRVQAWSETYRTFFPPNR